MFLGERIRLRRDERSDIPLFAAWLNDPEVRQYLSINLPLSLVHEEQWFENSQKLPPAEQPFAIEIREPGAGEVADGWRLIGNCGFFDFDWRVRRAEVGLFIGDKSCWNRGYGTEVMLLLLRIGFESLNLNRIQLQVDEANRGGIRAYEKAGFTLEGRFRQGTFQNGAYRDMLLMSVLRLEWDSRK